MFNWFKKEKVTTTIDPIALKLANNSYKKDPLPFLCGKRLEIISDGNLLIYPTKEELEKLGIKVVDFRIPLNGEYFISIFCTIFLSTIETFDSRSILTNGGQRFILEKI